MCVAAKRPRISGVIGPLIDQEALLCFKNLLGSLGSPNLFIQNGEGLFNQHAQSTGMVDLRANYLPRLWSGHEDGLAQDQGGRATHKASPPAPHRGGGDALQGRDGRPGGTNFDYLLLVGTNPR
jgi:hypothetical protein